jgi:hypothetical protein
MSREGIVGVPKVIAEAVLRGGCRICQGVGCGLGQRVQEEMGLSQSSGLVWGVASK